MRDLSLRRLNESVVTVGMNAMEERKHQVFDSPRDFLLGRPPPVRPPLIARPARDHK